MDEYSGIPKDYFHQINDLKSRLIEKEEELKNIRLSIKKEKLKRNWFKVINAINDALLIVDKEFVIKDINDKGLELFGCKREEAVNRKCHQIIFQSNEPPSGCNFMKALNSNGTSANEYFDAVYDRWLFIKVSPVYDDQNQIMQFAVVIQDITKQKLAEKTIKENEEKLQRLFNHSSSLILELDMDTFEIINCNPAMASSLRLERSKIIGSNVFQLFPDKIIKRRMVYAGKALEENKIQVFEDERDGNHFLNNIIPVSSHGRRFIQIIAFDITKRKKAEEQLKRSEMILSYSERISGVGSWEWDIPTDRFTLSDEWQNIHGLQSKIFSKEDLFKIAYHEDLELIRQAFRDALDDIRPYELKHRIVKQDTGEIRMIQANGEIIRDHEGNPVKMYGTSMDITDRKESEQKLIAANASKDKLFAIISHDLKNPIGNIKTLTEILEQNLDNLSPDEIKEYIKYTNQSADSLSVLINNLMTWSRSQRNKIKVKPEKVMLCEMVKSSFDSLKSIAISKEIIFQNKIPENLIGFADKTMMSIVIQNLISNAIKFTFTNGTIITLAYEQNNSVIIGVRDNGVGMDDYKVKNLFAFREGTSTIGTDGEKGTGLGLVICKEFVERNGGEIWVESDLKNGSTFYFSIPKS